MSRKRILITGASSGFGRDAAVGLAERGHTVFATMRGVDGKNREVAGELTRLARENDWALIEVVEAPPEDRPLRCPVGDDVAEPVGLLNETSERVQTGIMAHFGAGALT